MSGHKKRQYRRFTDEQVAHMRREVRGGASVADIAARLGERAKTIGSVVRGETYAHVAEPPVRRGVSDPAYEARREHMRQIWFRRRNGEPALVIADDLGMTKGAVQNVYYKLRNSRDRREKIGIFEDPREPVKEEEGREGHMKMTLWQSKWMTKGELGARLRRDVRDLERANAKGEPLQVFEGGVRMVYDIERDGQRWRARRIEG